jgi:propanol-preferring alcohol dehydrogenase
MKAMRLGRQAPIAEAPLAEVELPTPRPAAAELLLDVHVCAVCRTDLHVIEGDLQPSRMPVIPGHQIVGRVAALGPGCERFQVGDRVGVAWLRHTCGSCEFCVRGCENLCRASRYTGCHADGGFAEQAVVPEAFAYAIPETFTDEQAAPLLCAGIIGYRALARSAVPDGGRLGLYGFGSSAHVVLQIARHRGCEVFVATRGKSHRRLALRLGAVWAGETFDRPPVELDSAIVFAPAGPVVPAALAAIGPGGTVALAGIHMTPIPELDYETHLFHEKNLVSVEANTRADGEALLREAAEIPIRPEVASFPLDQANDVLQRLKQDRLDGTGVLVCKRGQV